MAFKYLVGTKGERISLPAACAVDLSQNRSKFSTYLLNVSAEIKTNLIRQTLSHQLANFGESMNSNLGFLFLANRNDCSPSASRFNNLCIQR